MQKFQWLLIVVNSDDYSSSIDFYVFNISFLNFKNLLVKMIQRAFGQTVLGGLVNKELNRLADPHALTVACKNLVPGKNHQLRYVV